MKEYGLVSLRVLETKTTTVSVKQYSSEIGSVREDKFEKHALNKVLVDFRVPFKFFQQKINTSPSIGVVRGISTKSRRYFRLLKVSSFYSLAFYTVSSR